MRKISIIHPSRGRGQIANLTIDNWMSKADGEIEYILSIDSDDPTNYTGLVNIHGVIFNVNPNKSAIEAINNAAKIATGDILIVVSDDFSCPLHWDTLLLSALEGKEDFCVKTKDGIQPVLMTLPIMDRIYYERFEYIYHPDYIHMGCDVEMTAVAMMTGKAIFLDLEFPHNHYSVGKFQKDAISIKNDKTYAHGDHVLKAHLRNNFGIENPIRTYQSIKWH